MAVKEVKERTVAMFVRGMKHSVRAKFKAWCCARELTHAEGIEELMRRFEASGLTPARIPGGPIGRPRKESDSDVTRED